jgi:hypothetical protein
MTLAIETEALGSFTDADEETLARLVAQLSPDNGYLIVHPDGMDGERYAQTAYLRGPGGERRESFVVEYHDGDGDHWQTEVDDRAGALEVLAGWTFGRPGWRDGRELVHLDF